MNRTYKNLLPFKPGSSRTPVMSLLRKQTNGTVGTQGAVKLTTLPLWSEPAGVTDVSQPTVRRDRVKFIKLKSPLSAKGPNGATPIVSNPVGRGDQLWRTHSSAVSVGWAPGSIVDYVPSSDVAKNKSWTTTIHYYQFKALRCTISELLTLLRIHSTPLLELSALRGSSATLPCSIIDSLQ